MIGIVGAGPGGLTAAVALRRAGFEVEVLERAPTVRPVGAGITLQVNAMRMLAALDLAAPIAAAGAPILRGRIAQPDGTSIVPLVQVTGTVAATTGVAIDRGALSRILEDALPAGVIQVGQAVRDVGPDARVTTEDGAERAYDAVIGADGIHSAVRTAMFGASPLRYSGYTCWRGLARVGGLDEMVERWGRGLRFGSVPLGPDTTYWFACANEAAGGEDGPDPVADLSARFAGFEPLVTRLIRATPHIMRHDLFDLPPLARWTRDQVTLLGDAAHAMTPNLGQGAGQAIEDALVLASALRAHGVAEGLSAYEAQRRPRATWFVRQSRQAGVVAQWEMPMACFLRDRLAGLVPRTIVRRQLAQMYDVPIPTL